MAKREHENSARIGLANRDIARILTIQAERTNTLERR
jgi:ribosomal protein L29